VGTPEEVVSEMSAVKVTILYSDGLQLATVRPIFNQWQAKI